MFKTIILSSLAFALTGAGGVSMATQNFLQAKADASSNTSIHASAVLPSGGESTIEDGTFVKANAGIPDANESNELGSQNEISANGAIVVH